MKKKILAVSLVVILVAALAIGGTLAYMTDRDAATNTFTVGNVDITLWEDYVDNSQLMPGITVNKDVKICNTGSNDAWVWYTYAVPTALVPYINVELDNADSWTFKGVVAEGVSDGKTTYTVYAVQYNAAVAAGAETLIGMTSVTLSPYIDVDPAGKLYHVSGGEVTGIDWTYTDSPVIYVNAYAIQKENFADVQAAYEAYVGQWGQLQLSWEDAQN